MAFTAKDVQKLREQTGAGMMDCKKALTSSDGDFEKAVEFLREKGLAAAAKKAGRVAAEGVVTAVVCDSCNVGALVEVNSETDFVGKNEEFQKFVASIANVVLQENPADVEALLACKYPDSELTVADMQREKVLTIGENIQIRRFVRYAGDTMKVGYVTWAAASAFLSHLRFLKTCAATASSTSWAATSACRSPQCAPPTSTVPRFPPK